MAGHPLEALAGEPAVAAAVGRARDACEQLRWHRALRRQWSVARTEAGVRCAHAGGVLDGVRLPVDLLRDVARGAAAMPAGPDGAAAAGALRVQAEVERLMPAPGASRAVSPPFAQLLARLHAAAVGPPGTGGLVEGELDAQAVGRPRGVEPPEDLRGLGPAPTGELLSARLAMLAELLAAPLPIRVPALVRAAVVHGELMALRPFRRANGAVARAVFRHLLTVDGVDPVGVIVPEVTWSAAANVHLASAAGFATGSSAGVVAWVEHCAEATVAGAAEGAAIADAVLAGRLGSSAGGPP